MPLTIFTTKKSGPAPGHSFSKSPEMLISCFEENSFCLHNMLPLAIIKQKYLLSDFPDFHHTSVSC